jgi:hypothetical protein
MDIATLSTALAQTNVQQQASVSLLKSSLDMARSGGADLTRMMQQSAPLPAGCGTLVDITA